MNRLFTTNIIICRNNAYLNSRTTLFSQLCNEFPYIKCLILQVVTIGKFEGGGAFNVIPDSVTIGGTFRAFTKESFEQLKKRIEEVNLFILVIWHFKNVTYCSNLARLNLDSSLLVKLINKTWATYKGLCDRWVELKQNQIRSSRHANRICLIGFVKWIN